MKVQTVTQLPNFYFADLPYLHNVYIYYNFLQSIVTNKVNTNIIYKNFKKSDLCNLMKSEEYRPYSDFGGPKSKSHHGLGVVLEESLN